MQKLMLHWFFISSTECKIKYFPKNSIEKDKRKDSKSLNREVNSDQRASIRNSSFQRNLTGISQIMPNRLLNSSTSNMWSVYNLGNRLNDQNPSTPANGAPEQIQEERNEVEIEENNNGNENNETNNNGNDNNGNENNGNDNNETNNNENNNNENNNNTSVNNISNENNPNVIQEETQNNTSENPNRNQNNNGFFQRLLNQSQTNFDDFRSLTNRLNNGINESLFDNPPPNESLSNKGN